MAGNLFSYLRQQFEETNQNVGGEVSLTHSDNILVVPDAYQSASTTQSDTSSATILDPNDSENNDVTMDGGQVSATGQNAGTTVVVRSSDTGELFSLVGQNADTGQSILENVTIEDKSDDNDISRDTLQASLTLQDGGVDQEASGGEDFGFAALIGQNAETTHEAGGGTNFTGSSDKNTVDVDTLQESQQFQTADVFQEIVGDGFSGGNVEVYQDSDVTQTSNVDVGLDGANDSTVYADVSQSSMSDQSTQVSMSDGFLI